MVQPYPARNASLESLYRRTQLELEDDGCGTGIRDGGQRSEESPRQQLLIACHGDRPRLHPATRAKRAGFHNVRKDFTTAGH
jgi:hypothetical protein